jgi:superfamily II DNA or RNA helicase
MTHTDNGRHFFTDHGRFGLDDLHTLASERIVRRGLGYARAGRVANLVAAGSRLEARVIGTRSEPYLVELEHDGEEILCTCSCPFDWEPFCKHAVAVLASHFDLTGASGADGNRHTEVEALEHAVRRKRALKEAFKIRRREGAGLFGVFNVHSPSGADYEVEIRSVTQLVNACTCLDHATSMLGTCKHVEAVLAWLRKRTGRGFARLATAPPAFGQVLADLHDTPRIRLIMPGRPSAGLVELAREFFDADGYFRRDPVDDFARFLGSARRLRTLVVYRDAVDLSERLAAERQSRARHDEVRRTVLAGGARIPGVAAQLYPFQVEGAAFLAAAGRALLGDEMGLGKTVQAIAADRILRDRGEVRRTLVVCPASLKHQWAAEINRFSRLSCRVVEGFPAARLDAYRERAAITIVNYELVRRDHEGIAGLAPDLLILDEAQRIRNWRTLTAETIKRIRTPFAFVLTGTPLQNRLDDLYSVMQVVDRRLLGPLWAYNERFVDREEGKSRILGYRNLDELRRRLAPALLRRRKEEVELQLPPRIDSRFEVELTPAQRSHMEEAITIAARLAKLAQKRPLTPEEQELLFKVMQMARMACNAAGLVDKETIGSPKLDELEQLLRDLCGEEGRKVVVFSEWEVFGRMAAERAKGLGLGFVHLHGAVPSRKRGDLIARFRDDEACKVFFSTDAGGVGLNLQFASTVINLELPWNPAVLDQRIGRVHRHGQANPVHVFFLISRDSFESGLEKTLGAKRALFDAVLDPGSHETAVSAPTSCLHVVRAALASLVDDEEDLPDDAVPDTIPATCVAEATTRTPLAAARKLQEVLGPRLSRVVVLASGQTVALVDKVDEATREAARVQGMAVAEIGVVDGLAALGGDSPFAAATVILDTGPASDSQAAEQRRESLAVAERKLAAAQTLCAANLGAEAIAQAHASMLASMRTIAAGHGLAVGLSPARLLYEIMVPRGHLSLGAAMLISRAEGLAAAYAEIAQPAPAEIARSVVVDAAALLEDARSA